MIDLGLVPDRDKHHAMAGASLLIHPSRLESFGAVLAEAWQQGVAALVNGDSAVLREHCEASGGGLWFRGYAEFAEALAVLIDTPEVRATLGARGAAYVRERFSWESIRTRYLDAIDEWAP
ncbi:MAG: glycosyltransferase [Actinobacteria bacterium]|nr:glycosyltransferase [Actinomycetota bacterium]